MPDKMRSNEQANYLTSKMAATPWEDATARKTL